MRINLNELHRIIIEALRNAYDVLGLNDKASEEDIKKAWRALAIKNHPDRGGTHGAMVDINNAKDRLTDKTALFRYGPTFKGYEDPNAPKTTASPPPAAKPNAQSGWNVQVIRTCPKCSKRVTAKGSSPDNTTFDQHTSHTGATCSGSNTRAPKDNNPTSDEPKPKTVGCGYCGRDVAVKDGKLVNHYQWVEDRDMPGAPPKCPNSGKAPPNPQQNAPGPRPGAAPPPGRPEDEDRFYYTYVQGTASKFWEVEVVGNTMHVRFGRIGSAGQTNKKTFRTSWEAMSAAARMRRSKVSSGYVRTQTPPTSPKPSAGDAAPAAGSPPGQRPEAGARPSKDSYKVYPWRNGRRVVRINGKLYGTGSGGRVMDPNHPAGGYQTRFNANDRAQVTPDGRKMKVKKPDSDHTQTWDPIDEVRQVVDELVLEMLSHIGED